MNEAARGAPLGAPAARLATLATALVAVLAAPSLAPHPLAAQARPDRVQEDASCDRGHDRGDRYCEVREYTLPARAGLAVDAGPNGGIEVTAWDRDEIRLVARVSVHSRDGDARALAGNIEIRTGDRIEARGPRTGGRGEGWAVSYELMVPPRTDLRLEANNGGISLERLTGEVEARTTNGGIHVRGGAGHVRGATTNGGLHVELLGERWEGQGVDLQTRNGGVTIIVPSTYSARLETGTVNGGMDIGIPVMVQGRLDRTLRTELGEGGALVRAVTTNGGVTITGG